MKTEKAITIVLLILAALMAIPAHAQTTFSSDTPFFCHGAYSQPVQYFAQFSCAGIFFYSGSNVWPNYDAELFIGWPWTVDVVNSFATNPYSFSYQLTQFTQPVGCVFVRNQPTVCTQNGTLKYNWTGFDANGMPHTGTVSATWNNEQICGNRCWWHPVLPTQKLVVNQ